jgi:gas vesicle protein
MKAKNHVILFSFISILLACLVLTGCGVVPSEDANTDFDGYETVLTAEDESWTLYTATEGTDKSIAKVYNYTADELLTSTEPFIVVTDALVNHLEGGYSIERTYAVSDTNLDELVNALFDEENSLATLLLDEVLPQGDSIEGINYATLCFAYDDQNALQSVSLRYLSNESSVSTYSYQSEAWSHTTGSKKLTTLWNYFASTKISGELKDFVSDQLSELKESIAEAKKQVEDAEKDTDDTETGSEDDDEGNNDSDNDIGSDSNTGGDDKDESSDEGNGDEEG